MKLKTNKLRPMQKNNRNGKKRIASSTPRALWWKLATAKEAKNL